MKMKREKEISKYSEEELGHRCHRAQSPWHGPERVLGAGWAEGKVSEASLGWPVVHPGLLGVLSWPPRPCEDRNKA